MDKYKNKILAVDILKTTAILMVIAVHTGQSVKNMPLFVERALEFGQMGVQIFFMISAFLLCNTTFKDKISLKNYYTKKYLRLAPSYYIGIALYEIIYIFTSTVGLSVRIETNTSPIDILVNVLLLNNLSLSGCNSVVPGGWSIGCLWLFYLIFPFLYKLFKNLSIRNVSFLCLILCSAFMALSISISCYTGLYSCNNTFLYFNIINQFPAFMMGIELYFIKKEIENVNQIWMLIAASLTTFISVYIFYSGFIFSFNIMPWITSTAAMFWFLWIDSKKSGGGRRDRICQIISRSTLEMLIIHPIFVYYGISYMYKIFNLENIQVNGSVMLVVCYAVIVCLCTWIGNFLGKNIRKFMQKYTNKG